MEWLEGQTKTFELPDDNHMVFHVWLNWIYRHHVVLGPDVGELTSTSKAGHKIWSRLVAAYALGDKLLDADFKDAVVDTMAALMFRKEHGILCVMEIDERTQLFERTTSGSMARKLLVYWMARTKHLLREEDHHALMFEIAKMKIDIHSALQDVLRAAAECEFHEHKAGSVHCYRTK